mgnify:CR=1 FL=1|tara:strand:- start:10044 stop:12566 length:2523 start_codon:yes stop_codon:yes gene_type:complete
MKKTSIILFIFSVFSVNIHAQITADEYGVLPIPSYFDTYTTEKKIKKVYNEDVSLNDLVKDSDSPLPWIVYSDRSKNQYLDDVDGFKIGDVSIGVPLVVYKVNGSWLEVGTPPVRENKKFVHNKLGWMRADQLIISPYAVIDEKGGPKKGMVLTSVNSFDKTDDVMKILENKHYFRTPDLDEKSKNKAKKFQFLFILKETNDAYLLSKTDNLSKSISSSQSNIRGWLPKGKVTKWNHRVCLEPSSDDAVVEAYKGKTIYVIDNESHYKTYLEQGSLPNKDWAIREIELKNRRPFSYQMRMPILPDWSGTDKNNKKVAAIAQMIVKDDIDDSLTEEEKRIRKEISIDREDRLAKIKHQLSETNERLNNVNILFVLDGTKSMEDFGPAIARSIKEFVKIRDSKFSESKYRFALAVYRNYADENNVPPLFEYVPFIGSENKIIDKLENLKFDSKNKSTHDEAHYYGMINAINKSKFNPKETNVLVLVGDAGNIKDDKRGLNRDKVINLLYEKNINLISYQVNYQDKTAYKTFNSDAYNYQKLLGIKHSSTSKYYTGAAFEPSDSENTFRLKFNTTDKVDEKEMYPIFGKLKFASKGSSMDVRVFEDNLVSSLDDYMKSLTKVIVALNKLKDAEMKEANSDYKPKEETGEDEEEIVFTKGFEEYLRRLGYSEEAIEMLKRQGEISAQGYLSLKLKGVEEEAFDPVIFISKEYKDVLSDKLDDISGAKGMKGSQARQVMYTAIVSVMKSIMGENVSTDLIDKLTFNQVWMQVLGVPFSGDTRMKNLKIYQIKTELDNQEFIDFYSDFAEDVEDFKKWDVTDKYSMWKKAGQTYYWIPLEEVPGCE